MWAQQFSINDKDIGNDNPVFIIAEAGVNHNGDIEIAKRLIDVAGESGADAIKFQTFIAEKVATPYARKAKYQLLNTNSEESQFEMIKRLELPLEAFRELYDYTRSSGLIFLSTPFDLESAEFLADLGISAFKISSGELVNTLLLKKVVSYHHPIILSTGMATLGEIEKALRVISKGGEDRLALLHCITSYPAPIEISNLKVIQTLKTAFNTVVGYSDHTLGITAPIVAVTLGAKIIEKHFTLDKSLSGPDHKASLNPTELKTMIQEIRNTEALLGNGIKIPSKVEMEIARVARRSIVAAKSLNKGEVITEESIDLKRPADGLSPTFIELLLGKRTLKKIEKDQFITLEMIDWAS